MKGRIFDIQRYSIHDGSGIRTVVFFMGCPLRCRWCANPESWENKPLLFYVRSRCIGCGTCAALCPNHETSAEGDHILVCRENCTGEYEWVKNCPTGALSVKGKEMETREVLEEIRKDKVFYTYSGGGVTFSGGEPLLHKDYVLELVKACKAEGIPTAIETTGFVREEDLLQVQPYVDLFLYDIKSMDTEVHRRWTGQGNEQILRNLRTLAKTGADIMVRTPMIPGVNDKEEDICAVMDFLEECGIRKYNILPFHQYGSGKYEAAGIPYELSGLQVPDENYVKQIKELILRRGFQDYFEKRGEENGTD